MFAVTKEIAPDEHKKPKNFNLEIKPCVIYDLKIITVLKKNLQVILPLVSVYRLLI